MWPSHSGRFQTLLHPLRRPRRAAAGVPPPDRHTGSAAAGSCGTVGQRGAWEAPAGAQREPRRRKGGPAGPSHAAGLRVGVGGVHLPRRRSSSVGPRTPERRGPSSSGHPGPWTPARTCRRPRPGVGVAQKRVAVAPAPAGHPGNPRPVPVSAQPPVPPPWPCPA